MPPLICGICDEILHSIDSFEDHIVRHPVNRLRNPPVAATPDLVQEFMQNGEYLRLNQGDAVDGYLICSRGMTVEPRGQKYECFSRGIIVVRNNIQVFFRHHKHRCSDFPKKEDNSGTESECESSVAERRTNATTTSSSSANTAAASHQHQQYHHYQAAQQHQQQQELLAEHLNAADPALADLLRRVAASRNDNQRSTAERDAEQLRVMLERLRGASNSFLIHWHLLQRLNQEYNRSRAALGLPPLHAPQATVPSAPSASQVNNANEVQILPIPPQLAHHQHHHYSRKRSRATQEHHSHHHHGGCCPGSSTSRE